MVTVVDKRDTLTMWVRALLNKKSDVKPTEKYVNWLYKEMQDSECDIDIDICANIVHEVQEYRERVLNKSSKELQELIAECDKKLNLLYSGKSLIGETRKKQASYVIKQIISTAWENEKTMPYSKYQIMEMINVLNQDKFPYKHLDWDLCNYILHYAPTAYEYQSIRDDLHIGYEEIVCKIADEIVKDEVPQVL